MKQNNAVIVGFVSFVMMVLCMGLIVWKSDVMLRYTGVEYIGSFSGIGGLKNGADVRYRGYEIGRIVKIKPAPENIKVFFKVSKDVKIPKGSKIKILFDGLVGENFLSIEPNALAKTFVLPGETLDGTIGSDLANFIDLGSQSIESVDIILNQLITLLTSQSIQQSLSTILSSVESTSTNINGASNALLDVLKESKLQETLLNLNTFTQQLSEFGNTVLGNQDVQGNIQVILSDLTQTTQTLNGVLESTDHLLSDDNVQKISSLIDQLYQFSGSLDMMFDQDTSDSSSSNRISVLQSIRKLKLKSRVGIDYAIAEKKAYYLGDLDFDFGTYFFRASLGDRLGSSQIIHAQQGFRFNPSWVTRYGLFYQKPGIGFDYIASQKSKWSLDLYDINQLGLELSTRYQLFPAANLKLGYRRHSETLKYDNLDLGVEIDF